MKEVIDIDKKVSTAELESFWARRLTAFKAIKNAIIEEIKARYIESPTAIRKATWVIDVPLWSYIIRPFGIWGPSMDEPFYLRPPHYRKAQPESTVYDKF